ncbi:P-loop containing nucleoside triphosphate hydrolase [Phytophthora cactorum]|nr:P-loop containing nucleoside triphosphate hydrolase [Phytophthora cactorum]
MAVWRSAAFLGMFGDPYLRGTPYEAGGDPQALVVEQELVLQTTLLSQLVFCGKWAEMGAKVEDAAQFQAFLAEWKAELAKLQVGQPVLVPGGYVGNINSHSIIYVVEKTSDAEYSFTVCNKGPGAEMYHPCKVEAGADKIRVQSSIQIGAIPATRFLDMAFWTLLFSLWVRKPLPSTIEWRPSTTCCCHGSRATTQRSQLGFCKSVIEAVRYLCLRSRAFTNDEVEYAILYKLRYRLFQQVVKDLEIAQNPAKAIPEGLSESLHAAGKKFVVIVVSVDQEQADYTAFVESLPGHTWLMVPFPEMEARKQLIQTFGVTKVPQLILRRSDGTILTPMGKELVMSDPTGEFFPWTSEDFALPKSTLSVSETKCIAMGVKQIGLKTLKHHERKNIQAHGLGHVNKLMSQTEQLIEAVGVTASSEGKSKRETATLDETFTFAPHANVELLQLQGKESEYAGNASELEIPVLNNFLDVPERVTSIALAVAAFVRCETLCESLLKRAAEGSSSSRMSLHHEVIQLITSVLVEVLPVPVPISSDGTASPTCMWRQSVMKDMQLRCLNHLHSLLMILGSVWQSVEQPSRQFDSERALAALCVLSIYDAVVRTPAADEPLEISLMMEEEGGYVLAHTFCKANFSVQKLTSAMEFARPNFCVVRGQVLTYFHSQDAKGKRQLFDYHMPEDKIEVKKYSTTLLFFRQLMERYHYPLIDPNNQTPPTEMEALMEWFCSDTTPMADDHPEVGLTRDLVMVVKFLATMETKEVELMRRRTAHQHWQMWQLSFDDSSATHRRNFFDIADVEVEGFMERKVYFGEGPVITSPANLSALLVKSSSNASAGSLPTVITEDDIMHLTDLPAYNGTLSAEESEYLMSYLTVPYTRIPLVVSFFSSRDRVTYLFNPMLQQLFRAVLFEGGDWVSDERLKRFPMFRCGNHLGTMNGLLLNELIHAPEAIVVPLLKMLDAVKELGEASVHSADARFILFMIKLGVDVLRYMTFALDRCIAGDDRARVENLEGYRSQLMNYTFGFAHATLNKWRKEAEDANNLQTACVIHSYLVLLHVSLRPSEYDAQKISEMIGSIAYVHNWHCFGMKLSVDSGDEKDGLSAEERLLRWLQAQGIDTANVGKKSLDKYLKGRPLYLKIGMQTIQAPSIVALRNSEGKELQLPPGDVLEAEIFETMQLHRRSIVNWFCRQQELKLDAQTGEILWRNDELKPVPDSMTQYADFMAIFGNKSLHCGLVARQEHRLWVNIVGTDFQLVEWDDPTDEVDQGVGAPVVYEPGSVGNSDDPNDNPQELKMYWECPACTCANFNGDNPNAACDVCGTPRVARAPPQPSRGNQEEKPTQPGDDGFRYLGKAFSRPFDIYSEEEHPHAGEQWFVDLVGNALRLMYPPVPDDKKLPYTLFLPSDPLPDNATHVSLIGLDRGSDDKDKEKIATFKEIVAYRTMQVCTSTHCFPLNISPDQGPVDPALLRASGEPTERQMLGGSLIILRKNHLLNGTEQFVPPRLLQGVVPSCLLENFRFWMGEDGRLRGEPVDLKSQWFRYRVEVEMKKNGQAFISRKSIMTSFSRIYRDGQEKERAAASSQMQPPPAPVRVPAQWLLDENNQMKILAAEEAAASGEVALSPEEQHEQNIGLLMSLEGSPSRSAVESCSKWRCVGISRELPTPMEVDEESKDGEGDDDALEVVEETVGETLYLLSMLEACSARENVEVHTLCELLSRVEDLSHILVWCTNKDAESAPSGLSSITFIELPRLKLKLQPIKDPETGRIRLNVMDQNGWFLLTRNYAAAMELIMGCNVDVKFTDEEKRVFDQLAKTLDDRHPNACACRIRLSLGIAYSDNKAPWKVSAWSWDRQQVLIDDEEAGKLVWNCAVVGDEISGTNRGLGFLFLYECLNQQLVVRMGGDDCTRSFGDLFARFLHLKLSRWGRETVDDGEEECAPSYAMAQLAMVIAHPGSGWPSSPCDQESVQMLSRGANLYSKMTVGTMLKHFFDFGEMEFQSKLESEDHQTRIIGPVKAQFSELHHTAEHVFEIPLSPTDDSKDFDASNASCGELPFVGGKDCPINPEFPLEAIDVKRFITFCDPEAEVGTTLPFDLSNHPVAQTAAAKDLLKRLGDDIAINAKTVNGSKDAFITGVTPTDLSSPGEQTASSSAVENLQTLIRICEQMRTNDRKMVEAGIATLEMQLNEIRRDIHGNAEQVIAADRFVMQRHVGVYPRVTFDFLTSLLASDSFEVDLKARNPFAVDVTADLIEKILLVLFLCSRIVHINRTVQATRALVKHLNGFVAPQSGDDWSSRVKMTRQASRDLADVLLSKRYYLHGSAQGTSSEWRFDPRFLVFEYVFDILLRGRQVQMIDSFLTSLAKGDSRVQQMIMGAGKTTVVGPLLTYILADKTHLVMHVMPTALLEQSRQVLRSRFSNRVLRKRIFTFEFDRAINDDPAAALQMFTKLDRARRHGDVVCASPESIKSMMLKLVELLHSLDESSDIIELPLTSASQNIRRLRRVLEDRSEMADELHKTLRLWQNGILIMDEVDVLLHPLRSELNFPIGNKFPIDLAANRWELPIYLIDAVLASPSDSKDLSGLIPRLHSVLDEGANATVVSEIAIEWLLKLFVWAKWRCQSIESSITWSAPPRAPHHASLRADIENGLSESSIKLLNLARDWLRTILPHVLSKINRVSYGLLRGEHQAAATSGNSGGNAHSRLMLAVPFIGKDVPSRSSEFAHPDVLIGLTILAYRYEGIRVSDLVRIVSQLKQDFSRQLGPRDQRPACAMFREWVGTGLAALSSEKQDASGGVLPLPLFQLRDSAQVARLHFLVAKLAGVVYYYVRQHVFPSCMNFQKLKISACGHELGSNSLFAKRIGFSGTPSNLLPMDLGECYYEPRSDGSIFEALTNKRIVSIERKVEWTARSLLLDIAHAQLPVHALIDTGALITGFDNQEVAAFLLGELPAEMEGVVYLDENDRQMILLRDHNAPMPLVQCGLSPSKRFTFYDQVHTTGMDIKQCVNARAVVTLGKDMTFRDYAQGAYRMRGIATGQSICLFLIPEVENRIRHEMKLAEVELNSQGSVQQRLDEFLLLVPAWLLVNSMRMESMQLVQLSLQELHNTWRRRALRSLLDEIATATSKNASLSSRLRRFIGREDDSGKAWLRKCIAIFRVEISYTVDAAVPTRKQLSDVIGNLIQSHKEFLKTEEEMPVSLPYSNGWPIRQEANSKFLRRMDRSKGIYASPLRLCMKTRLKRKKRLRRSRAGRAEDESGCSIHQRRRDEDGSPATARRRGKRILPVRAIPSPLRVPEDCVPSGVADVWNFFRRRWVGLGERRVKNVGLILEWSPLLHQEAMKTVVQQLFMAIMADGSGGSANEIAVKALQAAAELATTSPDTVSDAVKDAVTLTTSKMPVYLATLSLAEGETIRRMIHTKHPVFQVSQVQLRTSEGELVESSSFFSAWTPKASPTALTEMAPRQKTIAVGVQCLRFFNNEMYYFPNELEMLLEGLATVPISLRHEFFECLLRLRRRERHLWGDTPLAKVFTAQSEWHLLTARARLQQFQQSLLRKQRQYQKKKEKGKDPKPTLAALHLAAALRRFDEDEDSRLSAEEVHKCFESFQLGFSSKELNEIIGLIADARFTDGEKGHEQGIPMETICAAFGISREAMKNALLRDDQESARAAAGLDVEASWACPVCTYVNDSGAIRAEPATSPTRSTRTRTPSTSSSTRDGAVATAPSSTSRMTCAALSASSTWTDSAACLVANGSVRCIIFLANRSLPSFDQSSFVLASSVQTIVDPSHSLAKKTRSSEEKAMDPHSMGMQGGGMSMPMSMAMYTQPQMMMNSMPMGSMGMSQMNPNVMNPPQVSDWRIQLTREHRANLIAKIYNEMRRCWGQVSSYPGHNQVSGPGPHPGAQQQQAQQQQQPQQQKPVSATNTPVKSETSTSGNSVAEYWQQHAALRAKHQGDVEKVHNAFKKYVDHMKGHDETEQKKKLRYLLSYVELCANILNEDKATHPPRKIEELDKVFKYIVKIVNPYLKKLRTETDKRTYPSGDASSAGPAGQQPTTTGPGVPTSSGATTSSGSQSSTSRGESPSISSGLSLGLDDSLYGSMSNDLLQMPTPSGTSSGGLMDFSNALSPTNFGGMDLLDWDEGTGQGTSGQGVARTTRPPVRGKTTRWPRGRTVGGAHTVSEQQEGDEGETLGQELLEALRLGTSNFLLAYNTRAGIAALLRLLKLLQRRDWRGATDLRQLLDEKHLNFRVDALQDKKKLKEISALGSGAIAALALGFVDAKRRRSLALYALTRALQCGYNTAKRQQRWHFWGSDWQYGDALLFALSSAQVMYAYVMRPATLPSEYFRFIQRTGPVELETLELVQQVNRSVPVSAATLQKLINRKPGIPKDFPLPTDMCLADFCMQMLTRVVIHFKRFLRAPFRTLARSTLNATRSNCFLASFVTLYLSLVCMHRRLVSKDHRFIYYLAGLGASPTILLEPKSRRSELALYVLPRALDSLAMILHDRGVCSGFKYGEVALFSASMSHEMESMSPFLYSTMKRFMQTSTDKKQQYVASLEQKERRLSQSIPMAPASTSV